MGHPIKPELLKFNGIIYGGPSGALNRKYWEKKVNKRTTYMLRNLLEFIGIDDFGEFQIGNKKNLKQTKALDVFVQKSFIGLDK